MTPSTFFLVGTACVICLVPLAIYLMILSWFNQRDRVTILTGTWDGALLALGLSGFLVISGPVFLLVIDSTFRELVYHNSSAKVRGAGINPSSASLLSIGWLVFLISMTIWFLKRRYRSTVIYNVQPSSLLESLRDNPNHLGHEIQEDSSRIELHGPEGQKVSLEMEHQAFSHLTIVRWDQPHSSLRKRVESLWKNGAQPVPENLFGGWLFTSSLVIFMAVLIWAGFLIYLLLTTGRP